MCMPTSILILHSIDYYEKFRKTARVFISNAFFQLSLSVAEHFNDLSLKCCLSVPNYLARQLCFAYLCQCLGCIA